MNLGIKGIIHSLEFFSNLSEDEMGQLMAISSLKSYASECLLYYEKSQSDKLLFLEV